MAQTADVSKWICRIGLGICAILCLIAEPIALFVGAMATDPGTRQSEAIGIAIMFVPLVAAAICIGLLILLERFRKFQIYAAITLLISMVVVGPYVANAIATIVNGPAH